MVSYFTLLFLYGLVIWSTSPVSHWSSLRLTRLPRGTSSSTPPPPRDKTWQWPWLIFGWTKWLRARSSATQKLHEHDLSVDFCDLKPRRSGFHALDVPLIKHLVNLTCVLFAVNTSPRFFQPVSGQMASALSPLRLGCDHGYYSPVLPNLRCIDKWKIPPFVLNHSVYL